MAYISTEEMKEKRQAIKKAFPAKDGWKFSITRQHYSTIRVSIMQYPDNYDFGTEHLSVNHYYINDSDKYGEAEKEVLRKINDILHIGHFDESDAMTDYFHCAWYISIEIGKWDKNPVSVPSKRRKAKKEVSVEVKLADYYKNLVKQGTDVADVLQMMYS